MAKKSAETPLMQQYNSIKAKYPGALLLFRVGDFYETFGEDAIKTSQILGIVLTKKANGSASYIELAGFPHHSLENYLSKLVRAGQRVAICDQLEDPKTTKTIVKRGVTELVTPGVAYNDHIVQQKSNNYLAAIYFDKEKLGVSFLDISTGEFLIAQGKSSHIDKLLQSFQPGEIIYPKSKRREFLEFFGDKYLTFTLEDWAFGSDYAKETLCAHFQVLSLKGFGIQSLQQGVVAAGAIMFYLNDTAHHHLQHITSISRIEEKKYMWLDRFTIRNLELLGSPHDNAKGLIDILDYTSTPMGGRMLRKWIIMPLKDQKPIEERLSVVSFFYENETFLHELHQIVKSIGDLERLISKVGLQKVNPREVSQLQKSLTQIALIQNFLSKTDLPYLQNIASQLNTCELIRQKIEKELHEEAPVLLAKGNVIANGVDDELDKLRAIAFGGKDYLVQLQKREAEATGIPSLKIAFNNVFGYYLEVTHTHKVKVPTDWIRKQTLVNSERYITPELKEYEEKILGAEDKIHAIEVRIFNELVYELTTFIKPIQLNAHLIAQLDVLMGFAFVSKKNFYIKPNILNSRGLDIKGGRHPVIEKCLPVGEEYITNDMYLDSANQQIIIITGPNMAGKSALLRQTGLIVLMAQMGCFVPAKQAEIGLVDKIFTRVGASDNLSSGESTFMVEMNETASILNNLSANSLILLDEIGRGTSTYDGISIAWALVEFLHEFTNLKPKTLFATHYHELNELSAQFSRIKNFNVSVREIDQKIIFLRKLVPGGSEHSFGIHVAKMAGMPNKLIGRANEILKRLELHRSEGKSIKDSIKKVKNQAYQLQMFSIEDPVLLKIRDSLNDLDVNSLTPVEALLKLDQIQRLLKN